MKKILFLLGAAVISLTSCNKGSEGPPITDQMQFCGVFLDTQGLARYVGSVADDYVKKYQDGLSLPEMSTATESDGTTTLTVNFDNGTTYNVFSGKMMININSTSGNDVKTITTNNLIYTFSSYAGASETAIGGTIIITNLASTADSNEEAVELSNFTLSAVGSSSPHMTMSYQYTYKHTGLSTAATSDDKLFWSDGYVTGSQAYFGTFSGTIDVPISTTSGVYATGQMAFVVQNLGGLAYPVGMTLNNGQMAVSYKGETIVYNLY